MNYETTTDKFITICMCAVGGFFALMLSTLFLWGAVSMVQEILVILGD